jgi:hypothetical protein
MSNGRHRVDLAVRIMLRAAYPVGRYVATPQDSAVIKVELQTTCPASAAIASQRCSWQGLLNAHPTRKDDPEPGLLGAQYRWSVLRYDPHRVNDAWDIA